MLFAIAFSMVASLFQPAAKEAPLKTKVIYVKESKAPCTGVAPMECLQVKSHPDSAWENFYGHIAGFNYEPGYQYKLRVRVTRVKNPPADGSSLLYTLKSVMEKKKVATGNTGVEWSYIARKKWGLIKLKDATLTDSKIWIEFDTATKRFHGSGGCNRISGGYEGDGSTLQFKQVISTKMACMDDVSNQRETAFLQLLSDHQYKFDIADQTLNLYDANGNIVLMFGAQERSEKK